MGSIISTPEAARNDISSIDDYYRRVRDAFLSLAIFCDQKVKFQDIRQSAQVQYILNISLSCTLRKPFNYLSSAIVVD